MRVSAGVGGVCEVVSVMAAWPLVRDFCQFPWRRMFQEISGMGGGGGVFFAGVLFGGVGVVFFCSEMVVVGCGFRRWRPAAMAWGQKRPSRWLAGQGQVASSHVAVRAVTVGRKVRVPDLTVPFQPSLVGSEAMTAPVFRRCCASLKSCHEAALRRVASSKVGMGG